MRTIANAQTFNKVSLWSKKKLKLCNDHPYNLTEKVLDRKGMHGLTLKRSKTLKGNNLLILIPFKITFEYAFKY